MIGILGAVDGEIDFLLEQLSRPSTRSVAGIVFHSGQLRGHAVTVGASGVAKVNAAMAAEILLEDFGANRMVFNGTAGALAPGLRVGDLVISTASQQYDVNYSAIGFPRGIIPFLPTSVFPADPEMIAAAQRGARTLQIKGKVVSGKILTGESFVATAVVARRLHSVFHGTCVETEGGAVGQVCYLTQVPYIVLRGISDIPGRPLTDRGTFIAARRAQRLTLSMLAELSVS